MDKHNPPANNNEYTNLTGYAYSAGAERLPAAAPALARQKRLVQVRTMNKRPEQASKEPRPKRLFADFWLEGGICLLFAESGVGKSILAVQIANSISRGEAIPGFTLEAVKQRVLYFDFGLTEKMFAKRYSADYTNHYRFDENLYRAELNPNAETDACKDPGALNRAFEEAILTTGAKVLIVDDITYLCGGNEKGGTAQQLLKQLQHLRGKYGLSIMLVAHTRRRNQNKPITIKDLQGGKSLSNFCDTIFAIGASNNDKNLRYLKPVKARNSSNNDFVCVCNLARQYNFLCFNKQGFEYEYMLLKTTEDKQTGQMEQQILELHEQKLTLREIGWRLGISHTQVRRVLKHLDL
jgi:KaiC/GvpD/RAD55 family RecA-like ATPase